MRLRRATASATRDDHAVRGFRINGRVAESGRWKALTQNMRHVRGNSMIE